jgi:hypothetical protein
MADEKDESQVIDQPITLNIVHHIPEGLTLTFSDSIAVQHTTTEFIITFAQIQHPLVVKASDYETMTSVDAEVVARIVLSPPKMAEFIQALQENFRIYQRRLERLKEAIEKRQDVGSTNNPTGSNRTGES